LFLAITEMDKKGDEWLIGLLMCSLRTDYISLEEGLFPETVTLDMTISDISNSSGLCQT